MAQIGVAWVLAKEGVTAPIVGTTNLDNLKDILGTSFLFSIKASAHFCPAGAHLKLTEEEVKFLEEPYQPLTIAGHI